MTVEEAIRLSENDQIQQELLELRSFKRQMDAMWEMIATISGDLTKRSDVGLALDNCPNCIRVLALARAMRDVIYPDHLEDLLV